MKLQPYIILKSFLSFVAAILNLYILINYAYTDLLNIGPNSVLQLVELSYFFWKKFCREFLPFLCKSYDLIQDFSTSKHKV